MEPTTFKRWLSLYCHLPEKEPISSTDKPVEKNEDDHMDFPIPRCLTVEEIPDVVNHFRVAARNAMDAGKLIIDKRDMQVNIKRRPTTTIFSCSQYHHGQKHNWVTTTTT